jgi:hypothetical protein
MTDAEGPALTTPEPNGSLLTWVVRGVLALAALAAPILVYQGFTESDTADPVKQQRLREASRRPAAVEPAPEARP